MELSKKNGGADGAFTRVDLAAVILVALVTAVMVLPAPARTTQRSIIAQCESNLKQYCAALQLYGDDNHDNLPLNSGANWADDCQRSVVNSLVGLGLNPQVFYCPGTAAHFTEQDDVALFNYSSGSAVLGYVATFPGAFVDAPPSYYSTNANATINPSRVGYSPVSGFTAYVPVQPGSRVLVADATLTTATPTESFATPSTNYNVFKTYNWSAIPGGYTKHFLSDHLQGTVPAGANEGMLDGHVEWRSFQDPRFIPRASAFEGPSFYW